MQMVALKRVKYPHGPSGKEYAPGETFEALSERDAKALSIVGKAEYGQKKSKTDLPKEAMKRAPKKEAAEAPAPLAPTYQRRDMQAAGRTGEETPAPSSRRGRPPKLFGSPTFEEDE